MKFSIADRLLAALTGLVILFIGICIFVAGAGIFPFQIDLDFLQKPILIWQRIIVVAVALLLCFLGLHSLMLLFRRRREKGFIMQHTELGDVSISMHAMESMVKKCIDAHEELKATHTRISRSRDGVVVDVRISLASGINIPLTVNALQKQIKHYITSCSGVDVKEVRVMVETGGHLVPKETDAMSTILDAEVACSSPSSTPAESFATIAPNTASVSTQKNPDEKEYLHQRIFKREEYAQEPPAPTSEIVNSETDADEIEETTLFDANESNQPLENEMPTSSSDEVKSQDESMDSINSVDGHKPEIEEEGRE